MSAAVSHKSTDSEEDLEEGVRRMRMGTPKIKVEGERERERGGSGKGGRKLSKAAVPSKDLHYLYDQYLHADSGGGGRPRAGTIH